MGLAVEGLLDYSRGLAFLDYLLHLHGLDRRPPPPPLLQQLPQALVGAGLALLRPLPPQLLATAELGLQKLGGTDLVVAGDHWPARAESSVRLLKDLDLFRV
jgi:hypothetical protein